LLIGKYQSYESRSVLKFNSLPTTYDSAFVISAQLKLTYNDYYFRDSLGITSFNIYSLTDTTTLSALTYDVLTPALIGSNMIGVYSGTPVDSVKISIPIDTFTVRTWLKAAANSSSTYKNNGIVFIPNASSSTIKSFFHREFNNYRFT